MVEVGGHGQQQRVEDGAADDAHHQHPDVVPQLVGEESDHRGRNEHAEGEYGVHQGNVDVIDPNVLHVDGQVGHDGKRGAVEEEQGELERQ